MSQTNAVKMILLVFLGGTNGCAEGSKDTTNTMDGSVVDASSTSPAIDAAIPSPVDSGMNIGEIDASTQVDAAVGQIGWAPCMEHTPTIFNRCETICATNFGASCYDSGACGTSSASIHFQTEANCQNFTGGGYPEQITVFGLITCEESTAVHPLENWDWMRCCCGP